MGMKPLLSLLEIDVLRLLSEGKTIKVVAADLNISERKANKMYERIYRKLGVHNVVDCLRVAFRKGLLSQDQFLGTGQTRPDRAARAWENKVCQLPP